MSSTRRATDGQFHQEAYCSSVDFEPGLLANLVAKRCEALSDPKDRELIWALQLASHKEGLRKVAESIAQMDPELTDGARWLAVRQKLARQAQTVGKLESLIENRQLYDSVEGAEIILATDGFHADEIRTTVDQLQKQLAKLATDPSCPIQNGDSVPRALRKYVELWMASKAEGVVDTEIVRQVSDNLDYVSHSASMLIIEGPPLRVGVSFAARAWCDAHPGRARFVEVPASNDDISFYRSFARALGSASALSMKGVQLRERVEMTLQSSRLTVVLDRAHYLWPQSNRREALPNRLNWILTSLVNHGVPVALLTTPQFATDQRIVATKTGWTSAEFLNSIGELKCLPTDLKGSELVAIAKRLLPEAVTDSIEDLADCALTTKRFLAVIEDAVKRARFIAGRNGRQEVSSQDIREAINEHVLPSNLAIVSAFAAKPTKPGPRPIVPSPSIQREMRPTGTEHAANI